MYKCSECNFEFDEPEQFEERHGLDSPPYEKTDGCPKCGVCDYCKQTKILS